MTVCPECGGPLDPDTTHVQHGDRCPGFPQDFLLICDCPEVCAACCQDPDCPLRQPQETEMTDPDVGDVIAWLSIQRRNYIEYPQVCDNYIATIACIRRLAATVEQVRSQRDALRQRFAALVEGVLSFAEAETNAIIAAGLRAMVEDRAQTSETQP